MHYMVSLLSVTARVSCAPQGLVTVRHSEGLVRTTRVMKLFTKPGSKKDSELKANDKV